MRAGRHPALAETALTPFWLDQPAAAVDPQPLLSGSTDADLVVVGGGYTGLWTALLAKERHPHLDVILLEADRVGHAASGRNGGFCSASLTHGLANGLDRFADELHVVERLGRSNLDAIAVTLTRYGIDCDWERSGDLAVATEPWQAEELAELAPIVREHGAKAHLLDMSAVRAELNSPTYVAGLWTEDDQAIVDPAKLAAGLRDACLSHGVRIHERSPVTAVTAGRTRLTVGTPHGSAAAQRVALGTNAFRPLLRRLRWQTVPVYDYVLMTEPLSAAQLTSVGWPRRQGVSDSGNQFHYYRLTADNRILWGGYDAIYHFGSAIRPELERRPATYDRLAHHFFTTFPQLEGLRFSHAWAGVIDTCTRFCAFFGSACSGRLAYALGYTGLGVGASRFGARAMLGLLYGGDPDVTSLRLVRTKPLPFPPEPLRYAAVQLTRWSLARADSNGGRRNLWLRGLDRAGLGYDS
jgi:glycine/D-amino acid oxidase-like deaminating enzyme